MFHLTSVLPWKVTSVTLWNLESTSYIEVTTGFSLVHKNVHFDPFSPSVTPKTVQRGDNDVPQNSQVFLLPEVNVPLIVISIVKMSLRILRTPK